jgi:hypothetical protein
MLPIIQQPFKYGTFKPLLGIQMELKAVVLNSNCTGLEKYIPPLFIYRSQLNKKSITDE